LETLKRGLSPFYLIFYSLALFGAIVGTLLAVKQISTGPFLAEENPTGLGSSLLGDILLTLPVSKLSPPLFPLWHRGEIVLVCPHRRWLSSKTMLPVLGSFYFLIYFPAYRSCKHRVPRLMLRTDFFQTLCNGIQRDKMDIGS